MIAALAVIAALYLICGVATRVLCVEIARGGGDEWLPARWTWLWVPLWPIPLVAMFVVGAFFRVNDVVHALHDTEARHWPEYVELLYTKVPLHTPPERLLCAAIFVETGEDEPPRMSYTYPPTGLLFCGWRHGDCFTSLVAWKRGLWWWERRRLAKLAEGNLAGCNQGFLTSTGRFVGREEAKKIAVAVGQCSDDGRPGLFSEDIY